MRRIHTHRTTTPLLRLREFEAFFNSNLKYVLPPNSKRFAQIESDLSQSDKALQFQTVVQAIALKGNQKAQQKLHGLVDKQQIASFMASADPDSVLWAKCWTASTVDKALDAMQDRRWPSFLLFHTFNRQCSSRSDAYKLLEVFERQLGYLLPLQQVQLTKMAIETSGFQVKEYLEPICKIFINKAHSDTDPGFALNNLLCQLANYGTEWSIPNLQIIKDTQKLLVDHFDRSNLSDLGFFGLAYVAHFESPALARQIIGYCTKKELSACIEILTSPSFEAALQAINSVPSEQRTSDLWVALLRCNKRLGHTDTSIKLLDYWIQSRTRISGLMLAMVVESVGSFEERLQVLEKAAKNGVTISPTILSRGVFAPVSCAEDYEQAKQLLLQLPYSRHLLVKFLAMQARWEVEMAWPTYQLLRGSDSSPQDVSVEMLEALARAALQNPKLMWGDMSAIQQCIMQIKTWTRRSSQDVLFLFPSDLLVHSYICMLGHGGYQDELDQIMTWLTQIGFEPSKRVLCALIVHSQYGPTMQRLAGSTSDWPTAHEVELYRAKHKN